jgi:hypothetical protein
VPDPPVVRGPFEPLADTHGHLPGPDTTGAQQGAPGPEAWPWDDAGDADGGDRAWSSSAADLDLTSEGVPEYEPVSFEFPGLDDDDPIGSADGALDRLKALHLTAAAVAPQSLDAHFDQLLERQRTLISEYLSQADGPAPVTGVDDESLVGFGDDYRTAR